MKSSNPWTRVALDNVIDLRLSSVDKKSKESECPVLLCNYMDVYNNNFIHFEMDFMKATATEQEIDKCSLVAGDVIITKDSEKHDDIGVPALVREDIPNLVCGYHLAILRRARKVSELETVAELFKRHGGDVLIAGEVAADNGVLRVKIFDKAGNAPVKVKLDIREEWVEVLSIHVEKIVLDTLSKMGALRYGDSSNEFLRRVLPIESKIQQIIEITQTSPLRKDVRDKRRHLSIEIGQILGDISRLTSARQELETKLSKQGTFQTMQERIIAKGKVVDLLRVEALILGDAQLLNKSFRLSKENKLPRRKRTGY